MTRCKLPKTMGCATGVFIRVRLESAHEFHAKLECHNRVHASKKKDEEAQDSHDHDPNAAMVLSTSLQTSRRFVHAFLRSMDGRKRTFHPRRTVAVPSHLPPLGRRLPFTPPFRTRSKRLSNPKSNPTGPRGTGRPIVVRVRGVRDPPRRGFERGEDARAFRRASTCASNRTRGRIEACVCIRRSGRTWRCRETGRRGGFRRSPGRTWARATAGPPRRTGNRACDVAIQKAKCRIAGFT